MKDKEKLFQDAYKEWITTESKDAWDKMWYLVQNCCLNIGKTKCNGITVRDLEEKCLDATINIMKKIKNGVHPEKLSSYCYLWTIGQVWNPKHQKWERNVQFDETFENYAYLEENNILTICREQY